MYYKFEKGQDELIFKNVYSCPGMTDELVRTFMSIYDKVVDILKPMKVVSNEGIGWVLLELLNNAVRAPISISMNMGITDIHKVNFFGDIVFTKKSITERVLLSLMNTGPYSRNICDSIEELISGSISILECEERFRLKGSFTGNGGMGLLMSKKHIESFPEGIFGFHWKDGYYIFEMSFVTNIC